MAELQIDFESEGVVESCISNDEGRHAFVAPTDGKVEKNIFVDNKCIKKSKVESLKQGMRVRCRGIHGEKGPKAKRIEILS